MGYYHVTLTPESRALCTIVLRFGKYEYNRLPMGVTNSADIFQEKMSKLFVGFDYVRAYIDDLLVTTKSTFKDHLMKLETVLIKLEKAGLKVNFAKSKFCKEELEYLGFWITREDIKPVPKR